MDVKLTLKLEEETIKAAKQFAAQRNLSLSRMVEKYFRALVFEDPGTNADFSLLVKELSGIIAFEKDHDFESEYTDYLVKKYS